MTINFRDLDTVAEIYLLAKLEEFILNKPKTYYDFISFYNLKKEYEKDYFKILKELKPEKYKEEIELKRNPCPCLSCDEVQNEINEKIKELNSFYNLNK